MVDGYWVAMCDGRYVMAEGELTERGDWAMRFACMEAFGVWWDGLKVRPSRWVMLKWVDADEPF